MMLTLFIHSSSHMTSDFIRKPTSSAVLHRDGPWLNIYVWQHDSLQENPMLTVRKFLRSQKSRHLIFQIDYYYCVGHDWVRDPQNSVKQQKWTEGKYNSSIYQFKQEDRWKGLQKILMSSASRNLNYFISKYFHVILVKLCETTKVNWRQG